MPLPSQTARPTSRRSHMYRRSRRRGTGPLIAVVVLIAAGLALGAKLGWFTALLPDAPESVSPDESDRVALADDDLADLETHDASTTRPPAHQETQRNDSAPNDPVGRNEARIDPPVTPESTEDRTEQRGGIEMGQPVPRPEPRLPDPVPPPTVNAADRSALVTAGLDLIDADPVRARQLLSRALLTANLPEGESEFVRDRLAQLNETLVFSPAVVPGDPFSREYHIRGGDALSRIPRKQGLMVEWQLLQRINGIAKPHLVRENQRLKLVTGPFHVVVDKSDYRMDVYLGDDEDRVYVRSFPVGLGRYDSTPVGRFRLTTSKMENPPWNDSETGERFSADDPQNPIGEFWMGMEGIDERTKSLNGYGIHGTIEPESIGRQQSRGCVRLGDADIALVYEMLVPKVSTVEIRP